MLVPKGLGWGRELLPLDIGVNGSVCRVGIVSGWRPGLDGSWSGAWGPKKGSPTRRRGRGRSGAKKGLARPRRIGRQRSSG